MSLTRRTTLRALAGAALAPLARPSLARGRADALRFIPQGDLHALDPILAGGYVPRTCSHMVFDTLYATDSCFQVRPQMAEGHEIADQGRSWTIRLRDGLQFHDGAPVLARDCVASIRRWAAVDGFGQALMAQTDAVLAVDDRTLRFRLTAPFPLLVDALGKVSGAVPFMMPERLALTPPDQLITEAVGSGPFRFLRDEWMPGSAAAFARFDGYVPRDEAADGTAGGKVAHVARVEWHMIPDAATAMAALCAGEMDWLAAPSPDLLPLAARRADLTVATLDPLGSDALLRFNHLHPPFDDVVARRAVLRAVNQKDYLMAMAGDPARFRACESFFACGTPFSSGTGSAAMDGDVDAAREMIKASRYDGRTIVIIASADQAVMVPAAEVTADLLRRLGMKVDLVITDQGTFYRRRLSRKPPEDGGWNIFHTAAISAEGTSPASHQALRSNGKAGFPGWFEDPRMEALRAAWIAAPDLAARHALASAMEREGFDQVPYIPLGQFQQPTVFRSVVTGIVPASTPLFWNLRKASIG
jgi:peptide/nickel transport system substrate-binding protein